MNIGTRIDSGTWTAECYHRAWGGAQSLTAKMLVGIDLFARHVKKAGNRARGQDLSLNRLN
jgi:hypothetical protein